VVHTIGDVGWYTTTPNVVVPPQDYQQVQQWQQFLQHFVYETVGRLRIGDMFDIVVCALHMQLLVMLVVYAPLSAFEGSDLVRANAG
jgi:hypothetical protein